MNRIVGLVVMALMVLAVIWLYNQFSGGNIGTLGVPTPKAAS